MPSPAVAYAKENHPRFLAELKDLLRIPSISTLPEHAGDCRKTAETLAAELKRIGMENVRLIETSGHPLVYADWLHAAGKPTVLVYGHYDVQPADPLDEWLSPPFEPTERNGNLYARGAVDDKGQVYIEVKALESLLAANGALPLNVRVLLEGEEEVGGEAIAAYVASKPADLKADFALVCDTELFAPGLPTLCVGLRGMIYTELEVKGAKSDLHSGMYGGAAPNPFVSLAQIIAKLKDEDGHIRIPGFYDDVVPPSPEELAAWDSLPFDEEEYREKEVGARELVGEAGYSVLERTWARPTLDVHGIPGGFTGAGPKAAAAALVGLGGVSKAVAENDLSLGQRGLDDLGDSLCAVGEHQGHLRHGSESRGAGVEQQCANAVAGGCAAGLARDHGRESALLHPCRKFFDLCGFTGAVEPLEGDKQSARHGESLPPEPEERRSYVICVTNS